MLEYMIMILWDWNILANFKAIPGYSYLCLPFPYAKRRLSNHGLETQITVYTVTCF